MKYVKIYIVILLFAFLSPVFSQVFWLRQDSPVSVWLYRCSFPDTLNGWACGDSGIILHTSNGGTNWEIQPAGINYFVEDICFTNERLGWAIANDFTFYRSYVLKTTNGGINWNASPYPDSTIILSTIYFLDSLNGYMGGFNGVILKSTDAGYNWSKMPVDSSFHFRFHIKSFNFINEKVGAACGGIMDLGGVLWLTTNYGYNWHTVTIGPEPIFDLLYVDSLKVLATGGDFEYGASFSRSFDNWSNWNYSVFGFFGIGQSIAMRTPSEIWVPLAFSMSWAVSQDTGNTWTLVVNPDSTSIYDAVFADSTHGWAVGNYGSIYKFNRQIIGVNNNNLPVQFKLYQNYPNPFNPKTVISYELLVTNYVKLAVYDLTGREIKTLVNENQQAGKYEVDFSAERLASGVYFYKLQTDNFTETKKMVLLK